MTRVPDMPGARRELTLADLRFDPPRLPLERLAEIALEFYGIEGALEPLDGERDQNARITTAGGERYVLKISGAGEDPGVVDFQVQALLHLEREDPDLPVPRLVRGLDGAVIHPIENGACAHSVRLLDYLPGIPYQHGPFPSSAGLSAVGAFVARLGLALRDFSHPADRHFMPWSIAGGLVFEPQLRGLLPADVEAFLGPVLDRVARDTQPRLAGLRTQVIHQDAHGANLLRVSRDDESVTGVIDFGDMIRGPLACDLAACASHFIEEGDDPAGIAAELCRGYDEVRPLERDELAVLLDLVVIRQAMTLELFEFRRRNLENPPAFLAADQPGLIASLRRLATQDPGEFTQRLEEACA